MGAPYGDDAARGIGHHPGPTLNHGPDLRVGCGGSPIPVATAEWHHGVVNIPAELRVERSSTDRVFTGVVGGLCRRHHLDSTVVRLMLAVLSFAGGIGVAVYAVLWVLSREPSSVPVMPPPAPAERGLVAQRSVSAALVTAAGLVAARNVGWWPGDQVMVPVAVVGFATAALWFGGSARGGDPIERLTGGRVSPVRVGAGLFLALAGVAVLTANDGLRAAPRATAAIGLTIVGLLVVAAPLLWQLFARLREEQRDRIRSEERSEMAAHLHDSVLQTLALMQRATGDPRRMVMLARRQERELRTWLYGQQQSAGHATVSGAFGAMAAQVELDHEIAIELVTVGDAAMTDTAEALLGATREATINAARHAKVDAVAVYVEVGAEGLFASVRDLGCGFDPTVVDPEHRGISDSIRERVARAGGTATLESEVGHGTEWELRVPAGTPVSGSLNPISGSPSGPADRADPPVTP